VTVSRRVVGGPGEAAFTDLATKVVREQAEAALRPDLNVVLRGDPGLATGAKGSREDNAAGKGSWSPFEQSCAQPGDLNRPVTRSRPQGTRRFATLDFVQSWPPAREETRNSPGVAPNTLRLAAGLSTEPTDMPRSHHHHAWDQALSYRERLTSLMERELMANARRRDLMT